MKDNLTPENQTSELFTNPEPWEKWETKLVLYSLIIAVIGLFVLGLLINWFIL